MKAPLVLPGPAEVLLVQPAADLQGWLLSSPDNIAQSSVQDLKTHGAVVFRGFEISKDKETFGQAGGFGILGLEFRNRGDSNLKQHGT